MTAILDCDSHLFESRTTWRDHIDPGMRDAALAIEDDELGWPWLTWRGQRLYPVESQVPGDAAIIGRERTRRAEGLAPLERYDDLVPAHYTDAAARAARIEAWGLDASVVFPNFGLIWEDMLAVDRPALLANLRAANRWMANAVVDGNGRLLGVGHVTLADLDWLDDELDALAGAGIKLAMTAPAPVDGKRLSHPDLDRAWASFCDHDIAPVFHVGGFPSPFHPAWYESDPEPGDRLLDSVFLWAAPAIALTDLILLGTFERHPTLRAGRQIAAPRRPPHGAAGPARVARRPSRTPVWGLAAAAACHMPRSPPGRRGANPPSTPADAAFGASRSISSKSR